MPLAIGARLGSYEIVGPLGAGGMGEVYRAHDSRLGRDVAVKILPAALAADADRRARLEREARVLAALNHPHIAAIYGVEEFDGGSALILELAPGETLADRLRRGALPIREAVAVARQLADALDAAHEKGIVHRDLKPGNITLAPDGAVKVLDFGLAVATGAPGSPVYDATTQHRISMAGVAVGTPAYMSPEQARGQTVDKRTDIWAFGCVLFEMLSGRPPFGGETVTDMLAAILEREPQWSALPPAAATFGPALRRCLEKDVKRRLRDIGDVKLFLDDAAVPRAAATAAPSRMAPRTVGLAVATAFLLGLIGATAIAWPRRAVALPQRAVRFEVVAAPGSPLMTLAGRAIAISPDASHLVYTASRNGISQLMLRDLSQLDATPLAGTEGATAPFFSPDGRHIGFATLTELKRVPADGGPATTISHVNAGFNGAVWITEDTIVLAQDGGTGLLRVPSTGGALAKFAAPDTAQGEENYFQPALLPGGREVMYTVVLSGGHTRVAKRALAGSSATTLIEGAFGATYLASGHLAFGQGDRLMAIRYDLAAGQVIGSPVVVQEGAFTKGSDGISNLATAADGTALYVAGHNTEDMRRLVWIDRRGSRLAPAVDQVLDGVRNPRISPDGRRVAVTLGVGGRGNIWIFDLAGAAQPLKLTFKDHNTFPVWSPDGRQIAFLSVAPSGAHVFSLPADGSAVEPQQLTKGTSAELPLAWSPDGAFLLFYGAPTRLWTLRMSDRSPSPWSSSRFEEFGGTFSPDGRWVAIASNQSGPQEVWVRPFAGSGAPVRVSSGGGHDPVWARDGQDLFYTNGSRLMAVRVTTNPETFRSEPPRVLFEGPFVHDDSDSNLRYFDTAPDGRLLMIEPVETAKAPTIVLAQHWDEELKRLLPPK
jgi:serine/threonine-protein kinase